MSPATRSCTLGVSLNSFPVDERGVRPSVPPQGPRIYRRGHESLRSSTIAELETHGPKTQRRTVRIYRTIVVESGDAKNTVVRLETAGRSGWPHSPDYDVPDDRYRFIARSSVCRRYRTYSRCPISWGSLVDELILIRILRRVIRPDVSSPTPDPGHGNTQKPPRRESIGSLQKP